GWSAAGSRPAASASWYAAANQVARPLTPITAGYAGLACTASCPSRTSSRAAVLAAWRESASGDTPTTGDRVDTATRSRDGSTSLSGVRPARTENPTVASATVVARMPCSARPYQSVAPIPDGTTPRPGLMPTSPQQAAGMRTEPRP